MSMRERIAQAVSDEEWQRFRLSLKGLPTKEKLQALDVYYSSWPHTHVTEDLPGGTSTSGRDDCDVCIQVDNYIKALCRGGQLRRGATLIEMATCGWSSDWIIR